MRFYFFLSRHVRAQSRIKNWTLRGESVAVVTSAAHCGYCVASPHRSLHVTIEGDGRRSPRKGGGRGGRSGAAVDDLRKQAGRHDNKDSPFPYLPTFSHSSDPGPPVMIVCAVNEGRRALLLPALLSLFAAIPFFFFFYTCIPSLVQRCFSVSAVVQAAPIRTIAPGVFFACRSRVFRARVRAARSPLY